jgi:hypothetical protein
VLAEQGVAGRQTQGSSQSAWVYPCQRLLKAAACQDADMATTMQRRQLGARKGPASSIGANTIAAAQ